MPSIKKVRVGRSSPKLTHKSNDETKETASVSKRTTGKRKITSNDPAEGSVKDDDDEHVQPAKKQKGRKTKIPPKEMKKRNVKEEDITDEVELVVEEFSCPHCDKKFKSQPGCKYHVDHKVCQLSIKEKHKMAQEAANKARMEELHQLARMEVIAAAAESSPADGMRPKRRCTTVSPKKSIYAEDTDDDDEDLDEDEGKGGKSRKKKSTPGKKISQSKSKRGSKSKKTDDLDEEFSGGEIGGESGGGDESDEEFDAVVDEELAADDGDAKEGKKKLNRSSSSSSGGDRREMAVKKLYKLNAGEQFVTKYGIVEVIADDRFPEDPDISTAGDAISVRAFLGRQERYHERKMLVMDQIATGTRYRREELNKIYLESRATGTSLPQNKVWDLYCQSLTCKQLLTEGLSWVCSNNDSVKDIQFDTGEEHDPRYPNEYSPNRIVECKLIPDERDVMLFSSDNAENGVNTIRNASSHTANPSQMRLFLARRELTKGYDASRTIFKCSHSGHTSSYREGVTRYLEICDEKNVKKKTICQQRIEAIENMALTECRRDSLLTSFHGVTKEVKPAYVGNPHKIKEFKMHKMPPYLVFNSTRSSMYPEIYVSLGFRRGSQNRNYFMKAKQDDGYKPPQERRRLRKRDRNRVRMSHPGAKPPSILSSNITTAKKPVSKSTSKVAKSKVASIAASKSTSNEAGKSATKQRSKKSTKKSLDLDDSKSVDLPTLPSSYDIHDMDVDFEHFDNVPDLTPLDESCDQLNVSIDTVDSNTAISSDPSKRRSTKKGSGGLQIPASTRLTNEKTCTVIDTQVLAAECEAGRYPSINRFQGEHDVQCTICRKPRKTTLINCDFCKNSYHQLCLDKSMLLKTPQVVLRQNEPDDVPMCNKCISTCLFRRWRAENRRMNKWQHELAKAGLGNVPEAASLREEVNLNQVKFEEGANAHDEKVVGEGLAKDDTSPTTYEPCPDGGPGGLICCSYCTAAYSRFLVNTAKEMEAQSVSRVGQEVSEILEMLEDAKQRLQRASYVSQSNEDRRSLLEQNQTAHNGLMY